MRFKSLIGVLLVTVVAVGAFFAISTYKTGENKVLVVYTYESLLKWGKNPNKTLEAVFGGFEKKYGCKVEIRKFSDARAALLAVINEKNNPKADVIIGLDNVLVQEAIKEGVIEVYRPSNIEDIPKWLINSLDPTLHSVPYDYGLIALVYDSKRISPEEMKDLTLDKLASMSDKLVAENPAISSTGLNFMLWEMALSKLEGRNWTSWWSSVKGKVLIAKGWGDAYNIFLDEKQGRPIVVSYGTDPAYSVYFYNDTRYRAALLTYNGERYGWLQVEGISVVKGAPHRDLAEKFVDYFISPEVQKYIPLNNWMYPANSKVELPEVYKKYALDPTKIKLANELIPVDVIHKNLRSWLDTWRRVMS